MHHRTIYKENPTRCNNVNMCYMWKIAGRVVGGRCQAQPDNVHQLHA